MSIRVIPIWLLVLGFATEVSAQNRIRWRPGQIAGGLVREIERAFKPAPAATDQELREAPPIAPATEGDVGPRNEVRQNSRQIILPTSDESRRMPRSKRVSSRAVSVADVVKLVKRGLSEATIIRYIHDNGVKEPVDVTDLLQLHEEGVSEPVIMALQEAKVVAGHPVSHSREPLSPAKPLLPTPDEELGGGIDADYGASILAPPANLTLPPPPRFPPPPNPSSDN